MVLLKSRQPKSYADYRLAALTVAVFLLATVIIIRLFTFQILQHEFYSLMASEKHEVYKKLFPQRGSIYVKEKDKLYPLVTNRDYYLIYAEPTKIKSPNQVIDKITPVLNLEEQEWKDLLSRISKKDDPYEPIKHKISKEQMEKIKSFELPGLDFLPETYRYYPEVNTGGHILGYVGFQDNDKKGYYGLEGYYNKELSGKSGLLKSIRDALGSLVAIGPRSLEPAQDGVDLVLTIDRQIQYTACQKLKEFYDWFKATAATVIIMNPQTGAINAMCSFPDFQPDNYNEVTDINYFNNPAIFYPYEPGSVFKPITMAAALDQEKVTPSTTYEDTGEVKIGPYKIRNFDKKAHGVKTMTEVLELSLNTGAMFAAEQVGKDDFVKYVKDFGFGKLTDITLDTEVPGNISSLDKKGDIYYLNASFGQGITATPLQLVTAFSALANGGKLIKPYIVSEVIKPDGTAIKTETKIIKQVISQKTSNLISGMLVSVVEKGYDKKAKIPGYYLAGKTGTAQIAAKGGYGSEVIHTFVGYGPISNPQFVILLRLDKPQGVAFAADTLSPLFRQLANFLINYYQIPPEY